MSCQTPQTSSIWLARILGVFLEARSLDLRDELGENACSIHSATNDQGYLWEARITGDGGGSLSADEEIRVHAVEDSDKNADCECCRNGHGLA